MAKKQIVGQRRPVSGDIVAIVAVNQILDHGKKRSLFSGFIPFDR